ncbi:MAG: 30S ribosomal protein S21 [Nitrospiraceae bacterium]|nr:MAG: 30S ribosomal protein S21 [Nitrospiraceae bacterium]
MQVKVVGNNIEKALKTLKNKLTKEGVFKELKSKRYYEKPCVKAKQKRIEARKKRMKASRQGRSR